VAHLAAMDAPSPLEQLRRRLALLVGENAVFDGWSRAAVDAAAESLGIDQAQARLAMPKTQAGMIDTYIQGVDRALEAYFTEERLAGMKIRQKIRYLVWQRLEIMAPAREAVRRGVAILAMPHNLPLGARIGWRTADVMWRIAGDTSTDYNHYTKRLLLGGVYASTLLVWLDDNGEGWSETGAFLDRRIDDVMKIEKWKAEWRGSGEHLSVARFLGRLRYPPR
jgi:ubiquinone biosynthesis protein COQ9